VKVAVDVVDRDVALHSVVTVDQVALLDVLVLAGDSLIAVHGFSRGGVNKEWDCVRPGRIVEQDITKGMAGMGGGKYSMAQGIRLRLSAAEWNGLRHK
jgi:hypothetical protein